MGTKCTLWVWRTAAKRIDHGQPMVLLTLLALADIANDSTGKLFASHQYIADAGHLSPRSVRSSVTKLEQMGLIRTEPQIGRPDMIWLNVSSTTIFADGPEPDPELSTHGKPSSRKARQETPRNLGTGAIATPARTLAGRADKPIGTQEGNHLEANASGASAAQQAFTAWNVWAEHHAKSGAIELTDKRRRSLNARLRQVGGLNGWKGVLERIEHSPFLMGNTQPPFAIGLDFVLQPTSFTKILEGAYEGRRHDRASTASGLSQRADNAVQGLVDAPDPRRQRWGM